MLTLIKKTTVTALAALTIAGGLNVQANAQSAMSLSKMSLQAQNMSANHGAVLTRSSVETGNYGSRSSYSGSYNSRVIGQSGLAYNSLVAGRAGSDRTEYRANNYNDFGHDSFGNDRFSTRRFNDRDDFRYREISGQISYDHNFESAKLIRSRF